MRVQLLMQRWIALTSRLTPKRQQIVERVLVVLLLLVGWYLLQEEVCLLLVEGSQIPVNSQQLEDNQWWISQQEHSQ